VQERANPGREKRTTTPSQGRLGEADWHGEKREFGKRADRREWFSREQRKKQRWGKEGKKKVSSSKGREASGGGSGKEQALTRRFLGPEKVARRGGAGGVCDRGVCLSMERCGRGAKNQEKKRQKKKSFVNWGADCIYSEKKPKVIRGGKTNGSVETP